MLILTLANNYPESVTSVWTWLAFQVITGNTFTKRFASERWSPQPC